MTSTNTDTPQPQSAQPSTPDNRLTCSALPPQPVGLKRSRTPSDILPISPTPVQPLPPRPRRSWTRRSASWTPEEDEKLVQLVKKETAVPPSITASKTWSRVAAQLNNRTGKQCRERYLNQLRPGIRRDPWSPEEERILHEVHARIGNKWVAIAAQLPGRTDNCVKNHWNSMLRKRQRREAALQTAHKEPCISSKSNGVHAVQTQLLTPSTPASPSPVSPAVSTPLSVPLLNHDADRSRDAAFSMRTGYATPSGLSSVMDLAASSGVPSPYTASSPITPKRDVKLQISSLVAASNNEICNWGEGYFSKTELNAHQDPPLLTPNSDREIKIEMTHPPPTPEQTLVAHDTGGREQTQTQVDCSRKGEVMEECVTPAKSRTTVSRPLRRSSRLTAINEKEEIRRLECGPTGNEREHRKGHQKMRRLNDSVGNPLAALAMAASSVPPSPLTPESRFSATSRSRSASPDGRVRSVSDRLKDRGNSGGGCGSRPSTQSQAGNVGGAVGRKSRRLEHVVTPTTEAANKDRMENRGKKNA